MGDRRQNARQNGEKTLDQQKSVVAEKLEKFLKKNKVLNLEPDALSDLLWRAELPLGWAKQKLRTKKGGPRNDPAIIIDGEGLKFSRYFGMVKKARKKSKNKTLGKDQSDEMTI